MKVIQQCGACAESDPQGRNKSRREGIINKNKNRLGKRKQAKGVGFGLSKNPAESASLPSIRSNHLTGIDDLRRASLELRKLFSSSQPTSMLSLQGDVLDDLDQSPVSLAQDFSTPMSLGVGSMSMNDAVVNFQSGPIGAPSRSFGRKASAVEPKRNLQIPVSAIYRVGIRLSRINGIFHPAIGMVSFASIA